MAAFWLHADKLHASEIHALIFMPTNGFWEKKKIT